MCSDVLFSGLVRAACTVTSSRSEKKLSAYFVTKKVAANHHQAIDCDAEVAGNTEDMETGNYVTV